MRAWDVIEGALGRVAIPERRHAPPSRKLAKKDLAAVCAYYNPIGYRSRRENYERFVSRFAATSARVPLLTVELAMEGRGFELPESPSILRVRGRDLLWQKERLLNLGIAEILKRGYQNVVWLDADIEFADEFWPERTVEALERYPLCQLFAEAVRRRKNGSAANVRRGVVCEFHRSGAIRLSGLSCGYAWGATAQVLKQVPLYDAAILGSGDAAIWLAAISRPPTKEWRRSIAWIRFMRNIGPRMKKHYLEWAGAWGEQIQSRVGFVPQTVFTDYHGSLWRRHLGGRYRSIRAFDPARDLTLNREQAWEWNRESPSAGQFVAPLHRYFNQRREDE